MKEESKDRREGEVARFKVYRRRRSKSTHSKKERSESVRQIELV